MERRFITAHGGHILTFTPGTSGFVDTLKVRLQVEVDKTTSTLWMFGGGRFDDSQYEQWLSCNGAYRDSEYISTIEWASDDAMQCDGKGILTFHFHPDDAGLAVRFKLTFGGAR